MRVVQHDFSGSTLTLTTATLPIPDFAAGQHLIKVLAVAPCAGELTWPRPPELNISVPGVDAVGTVIAGPPTSPFQPGCRVYYRTQYPHAANLREYSIALMHELAVPPSNMSAVDAVAIPVSAMTAYQALFSQLQLPLQAATSSAPKGPKPRMLINGGSSSVGIWALQLARLAHLTTIATASPRNADFVKSLGPDEIIDYTSITPGAWAASSADDGTSRKVDYVLDTVGRRDAMDTLWPALKPNGRLLTVVPPANMDFGLVPEPAVDAEGVEEGVIGKFFIMQTDGSQLGEITKLVEAGKCKGVVDSVFKVEEFQEAFRKVDSGRAVGKVVIEVAEA